MGFLLLLIMLKTVIFPSSTDKLRDKIDGWKVQLLLFIGRIESIKSVLTSALTYYLQSYVIPASVANELKRMDSNFL